jgi:hypothetical protein
MSGLHFGPEEMFRFALWAYSRPDHGRSLTPEAVRDHTGKSRSQAYRLLAAYFAANGWYWGVDRKPAPISSGVAKPAGEHPWVTDKRQAWENRREVAA